VLGEPAGFDGVVVTHGGDSTLLTLGRPTP
jgi:hypothetical protein